ncbi:MAG: FtsW/RodA/SpoVE family cell cycle protein, partial [Chloroflexi bacterium]|nr:FtsW/RodA/SpoVE family cell cycle protein [Chloroflexota bacterium]
MGATTTAFVETFRARDWRHFDVQLLLYVLLLISFGIVMGYSAAFNDPGAGQGMSQTAKTVIWAVIGLTLFFVAASIDYRWLRTLALPVYVAVIGMLLLTMAIGRNLFGAQMSVTIA